MLCTVRQLVHLFFKLLDGIYKYQYEAIGDMIERPIYDVLGRLTNLSTALYSEQGITRSNSLPFLRIAL